jgi:short subunit dehydrogenase-like uncharacterized protein
VGRCRDGVLFDRHSEHRSLHRDAETESENVEAEPLYRMAARDKPVQEYLQKQIPAGGPSDEERAKGKTYLWGVARDLNGNRVESRLQTPKVTRSPHSPR